MIAWLAGLENLALATALRRSFYVYPALNTAHILGMALLVGAIVPMDLRILGLLRVGTIRDTERLLAPFAATGLALVLLSGPLLFITRAQDYVLLGAFWLKMAIVAAALINAALHLARRKGAGSSSRINALLSLLLWPSALILGRTLGYL